MLPIIIAISAISGFYLPIFIFGNECENEFLRCLLLFAGIIFYPLFSVINVLYFPCIWD